MSKNSRSNYSQLSLSLLNFRFTSGALFLNMNKPVKAEHHVPPLPGAVQDLNADAFPGHLMIDLKAIAANYHQLATMASPAEASAVVKADAYGLGAARIGPTLYEAGCRKFFVAQVQEAVDLKCHLPKDATIFVLNGLQPGAEHFAALNDFIPVLNSLEQIANWAEAARHLGNSLPAILQFDTGMSRLGLPEDEVAALLVAPSLLSGLDIQFIMSHLASANDSTSAQNADQFAVMCARAQQFPGIPLCFANSSGIFLNKEFHGALVRPGLALYGGVPCDLASKQMNPVVQLHVRVIQTRTVPTGTRVGYGATYTTVADTRLATIAAGYADGLPHSLSNCGAAFHGETRLPIVGRVSMDSMTVDISALPVDTLKLGSLVELIGPHQTLEDVAVAAGTISNELLTSLGNRYYREYL